MYLKKNKSRISFYNIYGYILSSDWWIVLNGMLTVKIVPGEGQVAHSDQWGYISIAVGIFWAMC